MLAVLACAITGKSVAQRAPSKAVEPAWPKPEKKSLVIATPNRFALPYLPLTIAQQLGYFSQMGLELEISEQQSMARAHQAVLAGQADVVCGWVEHLLAQQGKGQNLQSFVLMCRAPQVALGISSKISTGAGLAQLKSRKVGVLALGSPTHTIAHALLSRAGLKASQMSFVSVGSAASAAAALRAGQVDALAHMDPLMTQLEQRGEIKLLADTRSPQSALQALGAELPSSCLFASPEFLQRLPGTAQATSDAIVLALRWLHQASLLDIMKLLPDTAMGDDRQAFVGSLERMREAFSIDGYMPIRAPESVLEAMRAADPALRDQAIDPSRCFSNALVQRSARLRI